MRLPRQNLQRRVAVDEDAGVHPADPVGQLVEQPLQVAGVVHGEQAGAGQRVSRPGSDPVSCPTSQTCTYTSPGRK